ncbi:MAG: putative F0F1-ATPase subunit Ca2+/Mg2+ transporter [Haloplasmataceae bacterium]|jgi:F0F1-type ATP synthase assembly protein I|nr:putative F0F1-ATPase subunit Ca2+/Mg2+ transporter [Haloplasmataceae bacterium]
MNENNENKPKFTYEELSKKYLEKQTIDKKSNAAKEFSTDYSMVVSFIVSILILSFLGVFFGNKLDQKLNTTPLFILLFSFLGIAASFRNLLKDIKQKK